jgi:hypothetical protein
VALGALLGMFGGAATAAPALAGGRGDRWQLFAFEPGTATGFCSFPVFIGVPAQNAFQKILTSPLGTTILLLNGSLRMSFTNENTGKTITENVTGSGKAIVNPDNSLSIRQEGHVGLITLEAADAARAFAGYVTGGNWRFRYVAATAPMQPCQSNSDNNAVARIALSSNTGGQVAQIDLTCDGGPGSVAFATREGVENAFDLTPSVGGVLKISVYRNRAASRDEFVATNTATGRTQKITVSTAALIYRRAVFGATLVNPDGVVPPATNTMLWVFRDTAITSYSGTHDTICGPWPTVEDRAITPTSLLMYPSNPSNSCHNFGVWLKETS